MPPTTTICLIPSESGASAPTLCRAGSFSLRYEEEVLGRGWSILSALLEATRAVASVSNARPAPPGFPSQAAPAAGGQAGSEALQQARRLQKRLSAVEAELGVVSGD